MNLKLTKAEVAELVAAKLSGKVGLSDTCKGFRSWNPKYRDGEEKKLPPGFRVVMPPDGYTHECLTFRLDVMKIPYLARIDAWIPNPSDKTKHKPVYNGVVVGIIDSKRITDWLKKNPAHKQLCLYP